ncbi:MAG: class I SAM-dependent methyltransferase [Planctomycetota bacterium]
MDNFAYPGLASYELLDSGRGEKLERFGPYVLRRPDPQALWRPHLDASEWKQADYRFERESDRGGFWHKANNSLPSQWKLHSGGLELRVQPTPFKHVGIFPEQAANWKWVSEQRQSLQQQVDGPLRLLNLFGYTGVASILAAQDGWEVTHLDASRSSLDWAAENAALSGLDDRALRWILEDAAKFVSRESRRGNTYHGILLDPPHYGRGPKGEKWQFEAGIMPLLEEAHSLLAPVKGSFLILSSYAIGCSPLAFHNMLSDLGPGGVDCGELWVPESASGRRLPCGFCGRWQKL